LPAAEVICAGTEKNNGLVVLLTEGMKTEARTTTNRFCEFQLAFEIMEDPGLQIRLDEGYWVASALSKPDWANRRPVETE
jgi:hypothetical protein